MKLPHTELQKFMFAPKQSDHFTTSSSLRNIYFMWEFPAGRTGGGCWSRLFDLRCGSFTTVDTSSQLLKTHRPFSGCCNDMKYSISVMLSIQSFLLTMYHLGSLSRPVRTVEKIRIKFRFNEILKLGK